MTAQLFRHGPGPCCGPLGPEAARGAAQTPQCGRYPAGQPEDPWLRALWRSRRVQDFDDAHSGPHTKTP